MGHGTLRKMSLTQTDEATPSSISTVRPRPSRARFGFVKSTMMELLHTLVCKVSKVLKNQKTLASNQRKLVADDNVNHLEQPIEMASISGLDSYVELEDEEAFDVLAPQFQDDPHSEDGDAAVGGASDGDSDDGGDDDEEEKHGEDDGENEEGRGQEEEDDDEDSEYQDD